MNGFTFTDTFRHVLQAARKEAAALDHEYIGPEHILLGLLRADTGVPYAALYVLGVHPSDLQEDILGSLKRGKPGTPLSQDLPYTSRASKVIEEALAEARDLSRELVGTEHLLLGLIRERKGLAAQLLERQGLSLERTRAAILKILEAEANGGPEELLPKRPPPVPSSFLVVIEDPASQLGAQRFTNVQDAIDFLNRWRNSG